MKSYGNAKISHEVILCIPTELKGLVGRPYSYFRLVSRYLSIHPESISHSQSLIHDIDFILSELRTNLPLRFASLHVRGHQDEICDLDLLSRPAPFNVRTIALLMHLWISVQLQNLLGYIPCLPAESIFLMVLGISQATRIARSRQNALSINAGRTSKMQQWESTNIFGSINWTTCPSASSKRRCGATTDICSESHLYLC